MDLSSIGLVAGVPYKLPVAGRFFRILRGTGRFKIQTEVLQGKSIHSNYIAGIGSDLGYFEAIWITADESQNCDVLISDFETSDSRLTGDIDINGLLTVATVGGNSIYENSGTIANNSSAEILAVDTDRIEAVVYIDQPAFVSGVSPASASSFPLPAGYHTFKNTAAVYMFNNSGATLNYKIMGDSK